MADAMLPIMTKPHFKVRVGEYSSISSLMNKWSKPKKTTAFKDHMLMCNQLVSFDDFKVLSSSNSEFHLKIKESILISHDQPILNKHLFDYLHKYFTVLYDCLIIFIMHTLLFNFCCFQS